MTKEEIKQTYSMADIVERYGFRPNRSGFINCPFHKGDNTPSMKIYKDSFYCYGCNEGGDIFKFVMLMDGLSFKDAFVSLGGHYDHPENIREARHLRRDQLLAQQKRERKEQELKEKKKKILQLSHEMEIYKVCLTGWKPFSPEWCECLEAYFKNQVEYDCLREEVNGNLWQT